MDLAIIGLGRMGSNMARRLMRDGHRVVVHNRSPEPIKEMEQEGAVGAYTPASVVDRLAPPRVIWMMIPAGDPVDDMINKLLPLLSPGDVLIDGGNSNWKDSVRRAAAVSERGIHYLDVGTSGGIWGLEVGYCLMIGGEEAAFRIVEPAFKSLAPPDGYRLLGPSGAGHFAKMIHNGIEYGMLQAYAEGFEILESSPFEYDLAGLAALWNRGSVVRSWLLELAERAFKEDPHLESIRGYVEDSGEGRWTVFQAIDQDVPAPVLTLSLMTRFRSRQPDSFAAKVVAALRRQFGGHAVQPSGGE
ncbi:phosphogluconate dehydrogenase (NAD(+)-dependent, decarboxylating) [Sphaerobacter thermophilus]|jgi:6-phosphogluconate dehydrogenase|uniref:6-phosphogluconate dehydrogenase, decarboxylating n=1 Tax=Sphaerobacter thermophilus (strain ATCC 49802 / DSM 20745 / KCCM 41009 / NCIMB 13125 / S 6022) TaxID=479434 RepID=D1C7X9_SPHTD|nr:decarboxylating 6-phosphogluconate dehydrogenase [Sphaerobacter thermophilus]ACZ39850.1 6-phosphogluconate dehydrogenase, decarboxylating [Sphaerobacter thermophilus DSM 20745]PZN65066.1 MAG: decarboxylating 6-phosphogluconate dehydrogenase [Sphaerobacter thermophilus]